MKSLSALIFVTTIFILSAFSMARPRLAVAASRSADGSVVSDEDMKQQIVAKEREGLEALKTGDLERFGNLTADDAILVDAQGPASKVQVLKNVAGFTLTDYSMLDVKFVPVSPTSGLISYKILEKGSSHGREFTAQAYVSSIWTQRGNNWVCLFSQETAAR